MARTLFFVAVLVSLGALVSGANAQAKNEFAGMIGRTFISDHAATDTATPGALVTSSAGLTFEVNYGRRLKDFGIVGLTVEVPAAFNFDQKIHYNLNLVPKDYTSIFVTPSLRANFFPDSGFSPWLSAGGGFGYIRSSSDLEYGGPNPGDRGATSGVFQFGAGMDLRVFRTLSVRGEVRDFYAGVPQINVDIGKGHQHNFFVGGGVVWHF
jgi:hypothetical protein